jgi:hypothetical protein
MMRKLKDEHRIDSKSEFHFRVRGSAQRTLMMGFGG